MACCMQVLLVLSLLQSAPPWEADSLRSTVPAHIAAAEDVHADTEQLQGQQLLDAISHDMAQVSHRCTWKPAPSCRGCRHMSLPSCMGSRDGRRELIAAYACRPRPGRSHLTPCGSMANIRAGCGRWIRPPLTHPRHCLHSACPTPLVSCLCVRMPVTHYLLMT